MHRYLRTFAAGALSLTMLGMFACQTFDGPPRVSLPDAPNGLLADPGAPVRLRFSKPIKPETLRVLIVPLTLDANGKLADETGEEGVDLRALKPIYLHDPAFAQDSGGTSTLGENDTLFTITPTARFPVGERLAVLIEPGLSNLDGVDTRARRRIPFGFEFKCTDRGTQVAKSGGYFFLLNVDQPLQLQVQLYSWLDIDPVTGRFVGRFTNADRLLNEGKCPGGCSSLDVCQTSPTPACVPPSEKAQSAEDFVDFFAQLDPVLGYGVEVRGCAEDLDDGSVVLSTQPANLGINSPDVTISALTVVARLEAGEDGTLRGTGTGSADNARLGSGDLGKANGTVLARSLSEAETPADLPRPSSPAVSPDAEGGEE